jgi:hypothetical protein
MLSFHRPGSYAINFGLGNDNQLRTGGWSRGGNHVILDSGNYTSYAPNLGGGGASGTWGINITGNAGYAANAGNAYNGFGISQTWQDPGRSSGTWYQNTTGRAIMVFARWGNFSASVTFYVNPNSPDYGGSVDISFNDGDGDAGAIGIIVVPVNNFYTCDNWGVARELR